MRHKINPRWVGRKNDARRADARAELDLVPTEFGAFIDECQRLAAQSREAEVWRRELPQVIERIPRTLTEPQRAVVQSVLWRMLMHAGSALNGSGGLEVPRDAVTALIEGDFARGFSILLDVPERRPAAEQVHDTRIDGALRYLAEHYADPRLNLEVVAAHVNVSKWHFDRLLKKRTGLGFRWHLTQLRMEKARELLATTSLEMKEISARVGYKQPSEFDRHFRSFFGVTPTCFRGGVPGRGRSATRDNT